MMKSSELGPMNFGNDQEFKMVDIANRIKQMTNSNSPVVFRDPLLFMSPLGLPDITLAKEKLGWYPLISLEEGLAQTIEYVKANNNVLQPMLWKYNEEKGK
jgi:nucleoside-diphosphate-sugar epimerase